MFKGCKDPVNVSALYFKEMVWGNPQNLVPNPVFAEAIYQAYDSPNEDEAEDLNDGRNPWREEDGEPQETLDCESVQRFLVWCAYHQKKFLLRYYSPTRNISLTVEARVFLSVSFYPNIHPFGGQEVEDPDNPFIFTHRRNENVWCLVAWINDRENGQDRGRWITAREYNSADNDRRYPRVKGINDGPFFNNDVRGVGARRDCLPEVLIDEEAMQEPGTEFEAEPESEPEEEPPEQPLSGQVANASGPAQNTRSRTRGRGSSAQGRGNVGGGPLRGGRGSSARGRGSSGGSSARGRGSSGGRGQSSSSTSTRRITRSMSSGPAQNTRSRTREGGSTAQGRGSSGGRSNVVGRGSSGRSSARGRGSSGGRGQSSSSTPTRRITRSMSSGPSQNTRSRRG